MSDDSHENKLSLGTCFAVFSVFLSAFFVYYNTLDAKFALDDLIRIQQDPSIRNLSKWPELFAQAIFPGNLYRPMQSLSFAVNYHFAGLDPFIYHFTNVALHAFIAVFIFGVLSLLFKPWVVLLLSMAFAVHPIHVEAVANISGRAELLSHFFGLAAILLFFEAAKRNKIGAFRFVYYLVMCLSFLAALFSKESALSYLLFVPLICFFQSKKTLKLSFFWLNYVSLILCSVVYIIIRMQVVEYDFGESIDYLDNPLIVLSWQERALNAVTLLGKYILLVFTPTNLSADYSFAHLKAIESFIDAKVLSYLALVIIFVGASLMALVKKYPASFYALWFFCGFLVTSNALFPIGTIFGERLVYISSLGVLGIVVALIEYLKKAWMRRAFAVTFLFVCCLQTLAQNQFWYDNEKLFTRQITISPASAKTRVNYGVVLRNRGKLEAAKQQMLAALQIYATYADAAFGIATIHLQKGEMREAEIWLKKTLIYNPAHMIAMNTLARVCFADQRLEESERLFKALLKMDENNFEARLGLLAVMIVKKKYKQAQALRDELMAIDPKNAELLRLNQSLEALMYKKEKVVLPPNLV